MRKVNNFNIKGVERWIPFFSQTGTEIMEIIAFTGIVPEKIITNLDPSDADKINKVLFETFYDRIYFVPNRPSIEEYETLLGNKKGTLVTLHGWLRIVPKAICKEYKIYNGHPGLITKYPELKGKDPQIRAYLGSYSTGGCVIHEVIPEVDEGRILLEKEIIFTKLDLDGIFRNLTNTSFSLWVEFFNRIKWLNELH